MLSIPIWSPVNSISALSETKQQKGAFVETGSKIRKARSAAGLSQVKLAEMIGVSKQSMYKYESGIVTNIPFDKEEMIARICHVTPAYLLGWTEEDPDDETAAQKRLGDYFLALFEKLDDTDKGRLIGNAEIMLEQSKYRRKSGRKTR